MVGTLYIVFKADCPFGCPCDGFNCEPDKKSILVLSTRNSNVPVLIKFDGKLRSSLKNKIKNFSMG